MADLVNWEMDEETYAGYERMAAALGYRSVEELIRDLTQAFVEQSKHGKILWPPQFVSLRPLRFKMASEDDNDSPDTSK